MIIVVFYYYVGKKQHLLASLRKTERNIFVPSGLVTGVFEELPKTSFSLEYRDRFERLLGFDPENRGIYTQSDSSKKSSRNIWSLAVVSVDQRY